MFKKTTLFALLATVMLLTACSTTGPADSAMEAELPDVIKIGFIGPLTGGAAGYGQDIKSGVEYYYTQNPTIAGKKVKVIYEDGKCNGQDAASAVQKLINVDKVKVIIGGLCSGETLAMAPIVEQAQVLIISPGSSSPAVIFLPLRTSTCPSSRN